MADPKNPRPPTPVPSIVDLAAEAENKAKAFKEADKAFQAAEEILRDLKDKRDRAAAMFRGAQTALNEAVAGLANG